MNNNHIISMILLKFVIENEKNWKLDDDQTKLITIHRVAMKILLSTVFL